jgi:gamma-glutamyltranspeptidase/glutathione hydrolase
MKFNSRRSPIYATHGMVASSQPLASEIGLRILQRGGNAADAAVATAAALNVTEPTSTGIGGDCFCLYFDNEKRTIQGVNGSGRAPKDLTIELLTELGYNEMPPDGVHTVTVPGTAAGWVDTIIHFGSMTLKEVLQPAIELAENGFPVAPITARAWAFGVPKLKAGPYGDEMLIDGRSPMVGELMKNPTLAHTFKALAEHGKDGFYKGRVAEAIVTLLHNMGGVMALEDLENHITTFPEPIKTNYRGVDVYEIPPNGQGITALIALNILEGFDITEFEHSSVKHLHTMIEAMRIAFADARWFVADPDVVSVPIQGLISKKYAYRRRKLLDSSKATVDVIRGTPIAGSDTVYFCVVDGDGNACSFINSNYKGFGTGLIPENCGFTLQNRGSNFVMNPEHPNCLAPNKRPYHTIIPGMALKDGELYGPFGVMGGFMQPQGHVQVIINMVDYGMDPQAALDASRFYIMGGESRGEVLLEEGISQTTMQSLKSMGHEVVPRSGLSRIIFGKGQIILRNPDSGVLCAGSDSRGDGLAIGW